MLANDTDPDARHPDRSPRSPSGTNGTVAITGDGTGRPTPPPPNFVGTDTFTYTITDGTGATDTATVTVTVTTVNDAPVAVDDTVHHRRRTPR